MLLGKATNGKGTVPSFPFFLAPVRTSIMVPTGLTFSCSHLKSLGGETVEDLEGGKFCSRVVTPVSKERCAIVAKTTEQKISQSV